LRSKPGSGADRGVLRVGVISDTHGLLRPQATAFLQGCDHIVHGGDIGGPQILEQLAALAPVTAVRGNNDSGAWAESLPDTRLLEIGGVKIYVIHDLQQLKAQARPAGVRVIVSGHSHKPNICERDGVLYVNPGSAGPRRFRLPVSVAQLVIRGTGVTPELMELQLAAR
jgi:putative phosphoesterase